MSLVQVKIRGSERGLSYAFHPGQLKAWHSKKRIVAVISGVRSGKSSFGPCWLHREMRERGPGDYLIAAPNYPLIDKAAGPEVEALFCRLLNVGQIRRSPWQLTITDAGHRALWPGLKQDRRSRILFGHADDPDSLEAMTAKAAWLDECGQKRFRLASLEAIQARLSIDRGRMLLTSRPYDLGWLKQKIHDPWLASGKNHPEIDLIRFDSTENPAFPREEWERARRALPAWKFNLMYRAHFDRPAGLIYDCFNPKKHTCPRFAIPAEWPRYLGLDFGGVNTAAVFLARELAPATREPTGNYYLYRTYHAGNRTAKQHTQRLLAGEPELPFAVGGAPSEQQWRDEFASAGLPVRGPTLKEVEVGIDRVYAAIAAGQIIVFADQGDILDDLQSYSRVLDESGEPTDAIEEKEIWHRLDALRALGTYLFDPGGGAFEVTIAPPGDRSILASAPPEVWGEAASGDDDDPGGINWGSYDG